MSTADQERDLTRRTVRILIGLLAAFAIAYGFGRELGLSNDELLGYLLASVGLDAVAGLAGLILFGLVLLFRR